MPPNNITYFIDTIQAPGMYHKGNILLFPSKLEGLGLPLLEGLSCGLPAIICDSPPMNEFVQNEYNGYYVPVSSYEYRNDNVAFPETLLDIEKFIISLLSFETIVDMSYNARQSILTNFNIKDLSKRLIKIVKEDI
jgi:glycosyltransferase involved in cell wall biosynthesis